MTAPPVVLLLLFAALVGWPSIKLSATLIGRSKWREQRLLRDQCLADPSLGPAEKSVVAEVFEDGKGSSLQLVLPAVAFFGGIAVALDPRFEPDERHLFDLDERRLFEMFPDSTSELRSFVRDERFRAMSDNAFELAALRYPICSIATIVAILPAAITIGVLSHFKASQRKLIAALVKSSRNALRTFEQSFGGLLKSA